MRNEVLQRDRLQEVFETLKGKLSVRHEKTLHLVTRQTERNTFDLGVDEVTREDVWQVFTHKHQL